MKHARLMLANGLFVLTLYLVIVLTILIIVEMQPVKADILKQPVATVTGDDIQYLRLTDAPPRRDITKQRLAPLEVTQ